MILIFPTNGFFVDYLPFSCLWILKEYGAFSVKILLSIMMRFINILKQQASLLQNISFEYVSAED